MRDPSRNMAEELLDALLDGRSAEPAPPELAPFLQIATDLREELAAMGMSEDAVQRQLQRVLERVRQVTPSANGHGRPALIAGAEVQADTAPPPGGQASAGRLQEARPRRRRVGRRVATAVLAAVLLLVPTGVASASALPGEPLYPLKRVIEQVQVATAITPASKARVLTDLVQRRLDELQQLLDAQETQHLDDAIVELGRAMEQASEAVVEATDGGARDAALVTELASIQQRSMQEIQKLLTGAVPVPPEAEEAAEEVLGDSPPAPTTTLPVRPASSDPAPSTTAPPATATTPTTAPPATSTNQPSGHGEPREGSGQAGSSGTAPSTTTQPPVTTSPPVTGQSAEMSGQSTQASTEGT